MEIGFGFNTIRKPPKPAVDLVKHYRQAATKAEGKGHHHRARRWHNLANLGSHLMQNGIADARILRRQIRTHNLYPHIDNVHILDVQA